MSDPTPTQAGSSAALPELREHSPNRAERRAAIREAQRASASSTTAEIPQSTHPTDPATSAMPPLLPERPIAADSNDVIAENGKPATPVPARGTCVPPATPEQFTRATLARAAAFAATRGVPPSPSRAKRPRDSDTPAPAAPQPTDMDTDALKSPDAAAEAATPAEPPAQRSRTSSSVPIPEKEKTGKSACNAAVAPLATAQAAAQDASLPRNAQPPARPSPVAPPQRSQQRAAPPMGAATARMEVDPQPPQAARQPPRQQQHHAPTGQPPRQRAQVPTTSPAPGRLSIQRPVIPPQVAIASESAALSTALKAAARAMDWSPSKAYLSAQTTDTIPFDDNISKAVVTLIGPVVEAMTTGNEDAWKLFALIPRILFIVPPKTRLRTVRATIAARLRSWQNGNWDRLTEDAFTESSATARAGPRSSPAEAAARRAEKLAALGEFSRASACLAEPTELAVMDEAALEALRRKHPPAAHPLPELTPEHPGNHPAPPAAAESALREAIKSAPKAAAQDLFGWRAEHLSFLFRCIDGPLLRLAATMLQNPGCVPTAARPLFFGARLTGIPKGDGGIRPIAVGCALRRWIARAIAITHKAAWAEYFEPLQMGVGSRAGCERITHELRGLMAAHPQHTLVSLDSENAFNATSRAVLLSCVARDFERLLPWFSLCYGKESDLLVAMVDGSVRRIASSEGLQQGDPLGSVGFAIATFEVLRSLQNQFPSCTVRGYIDDTYIAGPPADVDCAITKAKEKLQRLGLCVNMAKSWCAANELPSGRLKLNRDPKVLGTKIFPSESLDLDRDLPKTAAAIANLHRIRNPQSALHLLRYQAASGANYAFRCTPPALCAKAASDIEARTRTAVAGIAAIDELDDEAWALATTGKGIGLAIPRATDIAKVAFPASFLEASSRSESLRANVDLALTTQFRESVIGKAWIKAREDAQDLIAERATEATAGPHKKGRTINLSKPITNLQKELGKKLKHQRLDSLKASASATLLQTIKIRQGSHSADFLAAIPSCPELSLSHNEAATAIALTLCRAPAGTTGRTCACGATLDDRGVHLLTCPKGAGPTKRHDHICNVIAQAAAAANMAVARELLAPASSPNEEAKYADITLLSPSQLGPIPVSLDIEVVHSTTDARVAEHDGSNRISVLEKAARRKVTKYAASAATRKHQLLPVILDVGGAIHTDGLNILNKIFNAALVDEEKINWACGPGGKSFWSQALQVALQRGNARAALQVIAASTAANAQARAMAATPAPMAL